MNKLILCLQPRRHGCVDHDLDPGLECRQKADPQWGSCGPHLGSVWHHFCASELCRAEGFGIGVENMTRARIGARYLGLL